MEKLRKHKRLELSTQLSIRRLDGGGNEELDVEVYDVSKSGVGFYSPQELPKGSVFESHLTIWTKEVIHALLEIVRIVPEGDHFDCGAIFVGMSDTDASRIEIYQAVSDANEVTQ